MVNWFYSIIDTFCIKCHYGGHYWGNSEHDVNGIPSKSIERQIMPLTLNVVSPTDLKDVFVGLIGTVRDVDSSSSLTRFVGATFLVLPYGDNGPQWTESDAHRLYIILVKTTLFFRNRSCLHWSLWWVRDWHSIQWLSRPLRVSIMRQVFETEETFPFFQNCSWID